LRPAFQVPHRNARDPAACPMTTVPYALPGRASRCHSCRRRMYHLRQELTAEALSMTLSIGEMICALWGAAVMKRSLRVLCLATATTLGAMDAMAIEEAAYTVVTKDDSYEIRDYAPHVVAETLVEGTLEEAGSNGP